MSSLTQEIQASMLITPGLMVFGMSFLTIGPVLVVIKMKNVLWHFLWDLMRFMQEIGERSCSWVQFLHCLRCFLFFFDEKEKKSRIWSHG